MDNLMPQIESPNHKLEKWLFGISTLSILAAAILSVVSWLEICSQECAAAHTYRLFGLKFEDIGLVFFPVLLLFHLLSWKKPLFSYITGLMLAGASGAEMIFIYAQKTLIGHWCPVCLSIAACVGIASLAYLIGYVSHLKFFVNESRRSETMLNVQKGITTSLAIAVGFVLAFIGIGKEDTIAAAENSIKNSITFGNQKSDVDVYLFSDWQCPACRQVEPALKEILAVSSKDARFTFADFTIHQASLNFTPYNLSFMIHNKGKYLELRDALTKLSVDTDAPTDADIEKITKAAGVKYKQLNYSDVALGLKYFKALGQEFDLNSTPTLVIVNEKTKKGKKLHGVAEITAENVKKAIAKLKE
jgi:protein-disulfide isomerase/uncharacterized membrane protein